MKHLFWLPLTTLLMLMVFSTSNPAFAAGGSHVQARQVSAQSLADQSLIHRVSDQLCATHTDFFKLWNNTTIAHGVCFANNGVINVNIFNVFKITSGNNKGFIIIGGSGQKISICQNHTDLFSPPIPDVVQVGITGRTC